MLVLEQMMWGDSHSKEMKEAIKSPHATKASMLNAQTKVPWLHCTNKNCQNFDSQAIWIPSARGCQRDETRAARIQDICVPPEAEALSGEIRDLKLQVGIVGRASGCVGHMGYSWILYDTFIRWFDGTTIYN